jgi:hypothetical protein
LEQTLSSGNSSLVLALIQQAMVFNSSVQTSQELLYQGGGLTVGASGFDIDSAVVVKKYAANVGDGSATSYHNHSQS